MMAAPFEPVFLDCPAGELFSKDTRHESHSEQRSAVSRHRTQLSYQSNTKDAIMSRMVVNQPQPVMYAQESDEWSSGICDCCDDVPECCFAFWCCPCFACKTSRRYGEPLCLPLLEIFSGLIPAITMSMRVSMRQRYGIRGTMCRDCVLSTFCPACSWCQMSREMKQRKIPIVMVAAKHT